MNAVPDVLFLTETVRSEIAAHAMETYPRECCGILLGQRVENAWRAVAAFPTRNMADAKVRDRYQMDPRLLRRARSEVCTSQ